jgi:hypothetical protein
MACARKQTVMTKSLILTAEKLKRGYLNDVTFTTVFKNVPDGSPSFCFVFVITAFVDVPVSEDGEAGT